MTGLRWLCAECFDRSDVDEVLTVGRLAVAQCDDCHCATPPAILRAVRMPQHVRLETHRADAPHLTQSEVEAAYKLGGMDGVKDAIMGLYDRVAREKSDASGGEG